MVSFDGFDTRKYRAYSVCRLRTHRVDSAFATLTAWSLNLAMSMIICRTRLGVLTASTLESGFGSTPALYTTAW